MALTMPKKPPLSRTEIDNGIKTVNDMVGEIAVASQLQTTGIEEINKGLAHINQIVQQNSAISEESASSSLELSTQSEGMRTMMSQFKFSSDGLDTVVGQKQAYEMSQPIVPRKTHQLEPKTSTAIGLSAVQASPINTAKNGSGKMIVLDDSDFGKY